MKKVVDTQKWGTNTAKERYGSQPTYPAVPDQHANQMPEDKHGPKYDNDTPESWVTGKNEDATTKPGFDHTRVGKR